jgi:hypothetical protein
MIWPKENYIFEIDHSKQEIILKTQNKKYYKRFDIPDLKRLKLPLEESSLTWKFQNNTLIIGYDKPPKILDLEKKKVSEIKTIKTS